MEKKIHILHLVILSLVFWIFVFANISADFTNFGGDSEQYIMMAESFAKGTGYRANSQPGAPIFFFYPPVFPLLLSPIVYFLGRNFYLMYLLVAVFGYLSLIFLYQFFKKQAGSEVAFFSTAYLGLSGIFIFYSCRTILSEIPYLFFSSFALFAAYQYSEAQTYFGKKAIMLVLGLIAAYLTRYSGIVLFPAIVLFLFLSRDGIKAVFVTSTFMAFFILWQVASRSAGPSSIPHFGLLFLVDPYKPFLGNILTKPGFFLLRFIQGINYYAYLAGSIFLPVFLKGLFARNLYPLAVFFLIIYGVGYDFFKQGSRLLPLYFIFYFLLIALWPFWEGIRFLVPLMPFLVFYLFVALKSLLSYLKSRNISRFIFYGAAFFVIFFSNTPAFSVKQSDDRNISPGVKDFIALQLWTKNNIPAKSVIASRKPTLTSFYADRQSLVYPFTVNDEEMKDFFTTKGIDYVIVDEFSGETRDYILPFVKKYHSNFKLAHRVGNTFLLERIK